MKKIKKYIKQYKNRFILLGICFSLFIILSILVSFGITNSIDTLVHSYILNIRNDNLTAILKIITNLAGASFLLASSTILLIFSKQKKISLLVLINLISAFLINEITKSIFTRTRPVGINLIDETGYSFPSGHSMVSAAFYGFLIYLIYKNVKNNYLKWGLIISLSLLIFLIGTSRIYLGVHYTSDVLAGFLIAISYLIIFTHFV
jgi:undecaprenyl-diphosphatase